MEWISVKNRFPTKEEQDKRIICWWDDGSELMGIQPLYSYIGPCDPYLYYGPSHWMPAPIPPVSGDENGMD